MAGEIGSVFTVKSPRFIAKAPRGLKMIQNWAAHPAGCEAVAKAEWERAQAAFPEPLPDAKGKNALIIGVGGGFGRSAADNLRASGFEHIYGVDLLTPPALGGPRGIRSATPGWYLTRAIHNLDAGHRTTWIGDAFSPETRRAVYDHLAARGVRIDYILFALATPFGSHRGQKYGPSALKVLGEPLNAVDLDVKTPAGGGGLSADEVVEKTIAVATPEEQEAVRWIMGAEPLEFWTQGLLGNGLAAEGMTAVALSYIGADFDILRRLYWDGNIGIAKQDVDEAIGRLNTMLRRHVGGKALTSMNPSVATNASINIPLIPMALSLLLALSEELKLGDEGGYRDPLQVGRLQASLLFGAGDLWKGKIDPRGGWLRCDDAEQHPVLQRRLQEAWTQAKPGPATPLMVRGFELFREHAYRLFGFGVEGVRYDDPVDFALAVSPEMGIVNLVKPEPAEATG